MALPCLPGLRPAEFQHLRPMGPGLGPTLPQAQVTCVRPPRACLSVWAALPMAGLSLEDWLFQAMFSAEPTGHLPQPPPILGGAAREAPSTRERPRPPAPAATKPHHPALEKRQCGRTPNGPRGTDPSASPAQTADRRLVTTDPRLAIARISQLSLSLSRAVTCFWKVS